MIYTFMYTCIYMYVSTMYMYIWVMEAKNSWRGKISTSTVFDYFSIIGELSLTLYNVHVESDCASVLHSRTISLYYSSNSVPIGRQ